MMKLTRHLFAWSPQARYMDYYERTLFNHRMGTIDPETGTTVYYLPLGSGYSKIYATCFRFLLVLQRHGRRRVRQVDDTIYFHDDDSIFVNLYIASEVNWPEKGIRVTQQTSFPDEQGTTLVDLRRQTRQSRFEIARAILGEKRQRKGQWACAAGLCRCIQLPRPARTVDGPAIAWN